MAGEKVEHDDMHNVENPRSLLDDVMPRYDANEVHDVWVPVSPEIAYATVKAVTAGEVRLFRPLMTIRALPRRLRGEPVAIGLSTPLLEEFLRNGFIELGERPDSEFVLGAIGRFWSMTGNEALNTIRTREDFLAFAEPGYSKAAMNLIVQAEGSGSRIVTETRVVGTSADATKLFGRYWFVIRWGSSAIRRSWLNAIRRRLARDRSPRPEERIGTA